MTAPVGYITLSPLRAFASSVEEGGGDRSTVDGTANSNSSLGREGDEDGRTIRQKESGSSVFGASFNFINSIVGAGIIGIPYAISQCGFVVGIIMLVLVAFLVNNSVIMLIECGIAVNKYDFEDLSEHLLGWRGYYITLLFMFVFAYGAQVAYLVVIGDTIPLVAQIFMPTSILASRDVVISLMSILVILPLCLLRDISALSWTSLLSIIADIALILIVVTCSPAAARSEGIRTGQITVYNSSVFAGVGAMSFAFVCQHNSFIVFRSLKEPTAENWKKVALGSVFFSFALSLVLGLVGFLCFENETKGDILNNFPVDEVPISVARVLLGICMVFVYPMECIVTRHCLITVLQRIRTGTTSRRCTVTSQQHQQHNHLSTSASTFATATVVNVGDDSSRETMRADRAGAGAGVSSWCSGSLNKEEQSAGESESVLDDSANSADLLLQRSDSSNNNITVVIEDIKQADDEEEQKEGDVEEGETSMAGFNGCAVGNYHRSSSGSSSSSRIRGAAAAPALSPVSDLEMCNIDLDTNSIDGNNNTMESTSNRTTASSSILQRNAAAEERGGGRGGAATRKNIGMTKKQITDNNNSNGNGTGHGHIDSEATSTEARFKHHAAHHDHDHRNIIDQSSSSSSLSLLPWHTGCIAEVRARLLFMVMSITRTGRNTNRSSRGRRRNSSSASSDSSSSNTAQVATVPAAETAQERNIRVGVTLLLWTSTVILALIFHDLGVVLAFTGAVAASMLGYVLPAVFYFKTFEEEFKLAWHGLWVNNNSRMRRRRGSDILLADNSYNGSSSPAATSSEERRNPIMSSSLSSSMPVPSTTSNPATVAHTSGADNNNNVDKDYYHDHCEEVVIDFKSSSPTLNHHRHIPHVAIAGTNNDIVDGDDDIDDRHQHNHSPRQIAATTTPSTNTTSTATTATTSSSSTSTSLSKKLWNIRKFVIPAFMIPFGFVALIVGVTTVLYDAVE